MSGSGGFTQTIDWLAFTLPSASVDDVIRTIGGDWFQNEPALHEASGVGRFRGGAGRHKRRPRKASRPFGGHHNTRRTRDEDKQH